MSYFDDASLVMIPSGYKDQKVYSVKPIDGSGDLTFSRASNATRVNSSGLVEKVRTNLVLQSQAFNTSWTSDTGGGTGSVNVTANYGVAPDGTTTADRIELIRGTLYANIYQNISTTAGQEYTASVYLKSLSGTPTVSFLYDSVAYSTTLTSDWVRVSVTYTASGSTTAPLLGLFGGDSATADFLAWGYQLEAGVMTDYIATTSSAVSVGPVSGLPRLDYSGGASCPSLLLEPERTNLALWSENFDNAVWSTINGGGTASVVVTANYGISPDGYQNADRIQLDKGNTGYAEIYQLFASTSGATYTQSMWLKSLSGTPKINFGFAGSGVRGTITLTNEWERYEFTYTSLDTTNGLALTLFNDYDPTTAQSIDVLAWGCMAEAGSYATSYIPTLSTAVTRVGELAQKTGISSLIGQTEGTIFVEFNHDISVTASLDTRIHLSSGTTANWIFVGFPDGGAKLLRFYVNDASGALSFYSSSGIVQGRNKMAFAYKSGDFVAYLNGAQVATNSTVRSIPTCSQIDLQGGAPNASAQERANYNQALVFKTRLPNSDLATLTQL